MEPPLPCLLPHVHLRTGSLAATPAWPPFLFSPHLGLYLRHPFQEGAVASAHHRFGTWEAAAGRDLAAAPTDELGFDIVQGQAMCSRKCL
ncbi:hypothetical protein BRADI_3g28332v3 [Brachypodium distachyon]|uniref:Uncharacterized protein n=1 Tax=Brachypodium distachyon TaxID=15368 RepID=A0A0Q3LXK0_BRADI|nr:hypothetical protein BRADI_3g28332v3 [Brachypodium distachyon]